MEDELARRRELRRRKILENAENRLKKITGDVDSTPREQEPQVQCSHGVSPTSHTGRNLQNEAANASVSASNSAASVQPKESFSEHLTLQNRTMSQTQPLLSNGVFQRHSETYTFPKKVSDVETRSYGRTRGDSRRNSSCTQMMMETLQFSSLTCSFLRPFIVMFVAFLWRLHLACISLHPLLEYMALPYLLLELWFYTWRKLEVHSTSGQPQPFLLQGALILCGFSQSVISLIAAAYSLLQCLVKDFSVYLFTVVVLDVLLGICV